MLSKETANFRGMHSAHSTVENSIITVRNKIVKGYMVAWRNMLHTVKKSKKSSFLMLLGKLPHCKDTVPKMRNK
jgi:hypothetical protein